MTDKPTRKSAPFAPLTTRNRYVVIASVVALMLFITLAIFDTIQRYPQVWPYVILRDLHYHLSRLGLVAAALMTGLGVYVGIIRKGDVTPLFRYATYIIFATMLIQSLIGLGMYALQGRPAQEVHLIYGMASVLALPFFIFVETTAKKRPAMGSYIWGFSLLLGVIIRSIMTGA